MNMFEKEKENVQKENVEEEDEEEKEVRSLNDVIGISEDRWEELGNDFFEVIMSTPRVTDILHWILDNYEGSDKDALLVMYGRYLVHNEKLGAERRKMQMLTEVLFGE